eukprot:1833129-Rhodomonas_salina.1
MVKSANLVTWVGSERVLHIHAVHVGNKCDLIDMSIVCPGVVLPAKTLVRSQSVVFGERDRRAKGTTWFEQIVEPAAWCLFLAVTVSVSVQPVEHTRKIGSCRSARPVRVLDSLSSQSKALVGELHCQHEITIEMAHKSGGPLDHSIEDDDQPYIIP